MLRNVQALRAMAALLVVFVHLEVMGAPIVRTMAPAGGGKEALFSLFAVGVDLFFVISGFIMVHTTTGRRIRPGTFMLNRLVRIAPVYWLLTILVFVLAFAVPGLLGSTRAQWDALAKSLAFIPYTRTDGTLRPILFVGWSLNLEMMFYLLFALALPLLGAGRRVFLATLLLGLLVALGVLFEPWLSAPVRFLTQPILLEFAAGMVIGWAYPYLPSSAGAAQLAAMVGVLSLVALPCAARWPVAGGWPLSALPAGLVLVCALVAERGGVVIASGALLAVGDASYALYLTHPFVTQALTIAAVRTGLLNAMTAPFLVVSAAVIAALVAVLFHRRVERPLTRWTREAVARWPKWRASDPPVGVQEAAG